MKAIWNDEVIAESNNTIEINREHYFPIESVKADYLKKNGKTGNCEERGGYCYYNLQSGNTVKEDAASAFLEPLEAAQRIKDYIVFDKESVKVEQ